MWCSLGLHYIAYMWENPYLIGHDSVFLLERILLLFPAKSIEGTSSLKLILALFHSSMFLKCINFEGSSVLQSFHNFQLTRLAGLVVKAAAEVTRRVAIRRFIVGYYLGYGVYGRRAKLDGSHLPAGRRTYLSCSRKIGKNRGDK